MKIYLQSYRNYGIFSEAERLIRFFDDFLRVAYAQSGRASRRSCASAARHSDTFQRGGRGADREDYAGPPSRPSLYAG